MREIGQRNNLWSIVLRTKDVELTLKWCQYAQFKYVFINVHNVPMNHLTRNMFKHICRSLAIESL